MFTMWPPSRRSGRQRRIVLTRPFTFVSSTVRSSSSVEASNESRPSASSATSTTTPVGPTSPPTAQTTSFRWAYRNRAEVVVIFMTVKRLQASEASVAPLDRCEVECVEPERVVEVLARLPEASIFHDLAETFRVLSDPGRVRLISALLEAGEMCVCDLAAVTGL